MDRISWPDPRRGGVKKRCLVGDDVPRNLMLHCKKSRETEEKRNYAVKGQHKRGDEKMMERSGRLVRFTYFFIRMEPSNWKEIRRCEEFEVQKSHLFSFSLYYSYHLYSFIINFFFSCKNKKEKKQKYTFTYLLGETYSLTKQDLQKHFTLQNIINSVFCCLGKFSSYPALYFIVFETIQSEVRVYIIILSFKRTLHYILIFQDII